MRPLAALLIICGMFASVAVRSQESRNLFDDPFVNVTRGIADCPVPQSPGVTDDEARQLAHERSQRGASCWMAGRCRLPSAYLYDKDIIDRAKRAVDFAGTFSGSSVWLLGQRRWIWIKGCISSPVQAKELERLLSLIDDVEGVVNELTLSPANHEQDSAPDSTARGDMGPLKNGRNN